MTDILVLLVLAVIISLASLYIYRAKKNGQRCIGCPHSKNCSSKSCNCGK